jgi:hypothetical protein
MRTILRTLKVCNATPALFMTASLGIATLVASTPADARIGIGRPGIGFGHVGSGLGFRPGIGVGRAGLGWAGWRGGLGYGYGRWGGYRGYGYGAAAVAGAALGYAAGSYGYGYPSNYGYSYGYGYPSNYGYSYGYGYPYGYSGYSGLYSYSPASYYGGGCTCP